MNAEAMLARTVEIAIGGTYAFRLPANFRCASIARSALAGAMTELSLPRELIDDAKVAVSELATNAGLHAADPVTPPELWIWARSRPSAELVIAVFDTLRAPLPVPSADDLLGESGRGLFIVAALSSDTGSHYTRSRLTKTAVPGKVSWFTLPLPEPWPRTRFAITPARAADHLLHVLWARGIPTSYRSAATRSFVIDAGGLGVRIEPGGFSWRTEDGVTHQPLIDLDETAEQIIGYLEADRSAPGLPRTHRAPTS